MLSGIYYYQKVKYLPWVFRLLLMSVTINIRSLPTADCIEYSDWNSASEWRCTYKDIRFTEQSQEDVVSIKRVYTSSNVETILTLKTTMQAFLKLTLNK